MADLMNGSSTYEELAATYNDFLVPAFKIKADGDDIVSSLNVAVEDLSIDLKMDSASSCNFVIANAYDLKNGSFSSGVKAKLKLGTMLEAEVGYGSETTLVFKGYISEVSYEFRDMPTLSVSALDVRRLMMNGNKMTIHEVQNYSQAFSAVMESYQKICSTLEVDATDDNLTEGVAQTTSDYKFIADGLTKKAGREFFVLVDTAYFREPQKAQDSVTTLEWGKGLLSFSRNALYQNVDVKVVGYDEKNKETVSGEASSQGDDDQVDPISEKPTKLMLAPDAVEPEKAQTRAESEADKLKKKSQGGQAVCVGLPEIVPGRFITLDKLDEDINGKYYIKGVRHSLGGEGFTTNFSIEGWKT